MAGVQTYIRTQHLQNKSKELCCLPQVGQKVEPQLSRPPRPMIQLRNWVFTYIVDTQTPLLQRNLMKPSDHHHHHHHHGAESFLRTLQSCGYSRTSQHFMEPSTDPYPEPDESIRNSLRLQYHISMSCDILQELVTFLLPTADLIENTQRYYEMHSVLL
jgi:hypothetical protein